METKGGRREFLKKSSILSVAAAGSTAVPFKAAYGAAPSDLSELTAVAAVAAMRRGDIKSENYARDLLDRAQSLEALNAFRTLDREMVLEAARAADKARAAGTSLGVLHGLPVPVKDSVNTKALPTSNGTRALRDFRPKDDAAVLKPLFGQGAILMGKTNIHELSYGWTSNNGVYGPVRNPYDTNRIPGGSSGGSAAAVAARIAPLAIAEDTLGSIRVPATMCGLAGLRPSFGRYPGDGIMPLTSNKFDQVGPVARSAADLALFDTVASGNATQISATPLKGIRIGISPDYFLSGLDPEVDRVINDAFLKLSAAGATLVWTEIPAIAKEAMGVTVTIILYETMPSISAFLEEQGTGISFDQLLQEASEGMQGVFKAIVLPPNRPPQDVYESMLVKREQIKVEIHRYFQQQGISALAFPPVMIPPPMIGEESEVTIRGQKVPLFLAMARNTSLGSCASMASLILPAGMTYSGLPIGMEFAALGSKDRELLSLGLTLEKVLGPIPGPNV
jgi:indoleacetamide hydrolase